MVKGRSNEQYESPWKEDGDILGGKPVRKLEPPEKRGEWHVFVLGGLALVVAASAVYYFYFLKPKSADVGLQFSKPTQVLLGEPFSLTVSYANYSNYVLKNVSLSLVLPDGFYFTGQTQDQRVAEQAIGDLGPGSVGQQNFNLIAISGSNAVKNVGAKLAYTAPNSSAQFDYNAQTDVLVGQPVVQLNLSAPQSVFNGQDFDIKITYSNNSSQELNNLRLKADYPPIYKFTRSTMQAENSGNNSWNLGTLAPGSAGAVSVTGNMLGPEKAFVGFNAELTADYLGQTYQINSQSASVAIAAAPLSLSVNVSGASDGDAVKPGDNLTYTINYQNNADIVMQNAAIAAKLNGEMFSLQSVRSDGTFSSLNNTITWIGANSPQLLNIAPGQSGSVSFTVSAQNNYPIRLLSDKNYTLEVDAQMTSPTVPPGTNAPQTISLASAESNVVGNLTLSSEAYWRDAASGVLNSGPYPPQVNQPTDYTIHWVLTNYATDVANVTVSAYLQSGSKLTGVVKSNLDTQPAYDQNSGLVTWQIPFLPATKGIVGEPAEAIFQVENTPAVNQVGQNVSLLGPTSIQWTDSFVGQTLQSSAMALGTDLPYDKTVSGISNKGVRQ